MPTSSENPNAPVGIHQALQRIPCFEGLSPNLVAEIARRAVHRRFDAGQVIFLEGEPAGRLYVLESGWIKAARMSPEGREQAVQFLKPCDIFGDIAIWTGSPYPCTVMALESAEIWAIERADIFDLIGRYPELSKAIIRRLGERVKHCISMVEDLALRNVEARLASNLLKHAEHSGDRWIVPRRAWATFDEMAVRLGTVRDVLSRALRGLEKDGLLRVERKAIVILDPEGLAARCDADWQSHPMLCKTGRAGIREPRV